MLTMATKPAVGVATAKRSASPGNTALDGSSRSTVLVARLQKTSRASPPLARSSGGGVALPRREARGAVGAVAQMRAQRLGVRLVGEQAIERQLRQAGRCAHRAASSAGAHSALA